MKKVLVIIGGLFAVTAGTYFMGGCSSKDTEANLDDQSQSLAEMRSVVLEEVRATAFEQNRSYPGSVKACDEAKLAFRVSGPLVQVDIKPGDVVKKGQVLMQIDPRDFEDNIRVLEAQLAGAIAQRENARQDFDRAKTLFDQEVIPEADFDHARNAYDAAVASVKNINARLQIATHQLSDTSLRSPYDGIITVQLVENYEMIHAGQVVLGLHNISQLEIDVNVPENEIVRHPLRSGDKGIVEFPSLAGKTFTVRLKEWSTAADPLTRTYTVTFSLPAPKDFQILPGMTAEVVWSGTDAIKPVLSIPASAVFPDKTGKSLVWVYDKDSEMAVLRTVELGEMVGSSRLKVLSGLSAGEQIVTEGVDFITETMKLTPIKIN